ncbi:hypothetical protein BGW42_000284 [Actinomortierella wolfii]|nr:hypothetical protein BGW42_000284 [Actinomortierella wolfii]
MLRSAPDTRPQKPKAKSLAHALKLKKDKSDTHSRSPVIPPRSDSLNAPLSSKPQQQQQHQQQQQPEERWTVVESQNYSPLKSVQPFGPIEVTKSSSSLGTHVKKGSWSPNFQVIPEVREPQDEPCANQEQRNGQDSKKGSSGAVNNSSSNEEEWFNLSSDPSPATAFLIREIQRLANHDFDSHGKPAPFPQELQALFQKLCDLSVCLRSARKNARNSPFAKHAHGFGNGLSPSTRTSPRTPRSRTLSVVSPGKRPFDPFAGSEGNHRQQQLPHKGADPQSSSNNPSSTSASSSIQQQAIIQDLEHQLAQSRKAHYDLLQAHITNVSRQFSPLSSPNSSSIDSLLNLKHTGISGGGTCHSDNKDPKDTSEKQNLEGLGPQQQQQQQPPQATRSSEKCASASSTLAPTSQEEFSTTGSGLRLSVIGREAEFNQLALKQAIKRLLEAQKELGMLKMLMIQSQGDIQELEEEILHKEGQLKRHYDLFHSIVSSQQLSLQIKVDQGTERIRQLEAQIDQSTLENVERLQNEIQELQAQISALNTNKDAKQDKFTELESLVSKLESEIASHESTIQGLQTKLIQAEKAAADAEAKYLALTEEIEVQRTKMEANLEENMDMVEHMSNKHKKKMVELSSHLRKSRSEARKLQQEIQQMALKIVRLQSLNEELEEKAGKDRQHIQSLTESIEGYKQTIDQLQQQQHGHSENSTVAQENAADLTKYTREIASLETRIEELEHELRAKETEMEQSVEAAERLALRLEESETRLSQELAAQKQQHEQAIQRLREETQAQSQLERKLVGQSVTLYQGMAARLEKELNETQEKLRETMLCWGHTKEQCMRYEASYRKKKRELEETTKSLEEVHVTLARLGDAIGLLEHEKDLNQKLSEELQRKDEELHELEQRLLQLEGSN